MVELDGRREHEWDALDQFVARHGLDLDVAAEAALLADVEIARRLVDVDVSAGRARPPLPRPHPGAAGARDRPPRPGGADVRAEEAARAAGAGQPGARHEPEGAPGAARRRRRRGRRPGLRGGRDDGGRLALRTAERHLDPRRRADGPAGRAHAMRGRGAAESAAGHSRARHVCRDPLRLRNRGRLRRRRRHPVVEDVPRLGVRVTRDQGAVHLGRRLRGVDGEVGGEVDALPRGALPVGRSRGRLAGRPERLDLLRRARAQPPRRHPRRPRRERPRSVARSRGGFGERRRREPLGDPQDGEADGPVPAGHGLRHLRLLGRSRATTTCSAAATTTRTTSTSG